MREMEEEKKRKRPTVAEMREMEEVIHRQCQELDAWREKYRELDAKNDELYDMYLAEKKENEYLQNRSFIGRLLNR